MTELFLINVIATACGAVIFFRAVNVIRHMDRRTWTGRYITWLAFGLSYALLAVASLGSVISFWQGRFEIEHIVWLGASAGLILFDRRKRRNLAKAVDPDETLPLGAQ